MSGVVCSQGGQRPDQGIEPHTGSRLRNGEKQGIPAGSQAPVARRCGRVPAQIVRCRHHRESLRSDRMEYRRVARADRQKSHLGRECG